MPGLWMLAYSVWPSWLNAGPQNSLSFNSFRATENGSPLSVTPIRWLMPSPSSARMRPPCGETVMLSGPS